MKLFGTILTLAALALVLAGSSGSAVSSVQQATDDAKVELYKKFRDNYESNQAVAYEAAKEYLQKYQNDKDQYTDYLQRWVGLYERNDRKRRLPILINQKNYAEAFAIGARILADEPEYIRAQIDLAYAGYFAALARDETHSQTALNYARVAIEGLEKGKAPDSWAPFKDKDETLAYLNYSAGFLTLKTAPAQAIDYFLKAAGYESAIRNTPSTYYYLAAAYETGPYKTMSEAYQLEYANKPETAESKTALEKLNVLIDRIIDAYARAIALAGTGPDMEKSRQEWLEHLTRFYKFRHPDDDAGLTQFISDSIKKPLPAKP